MPTEDILQDGVTVTRTYTDVFPRSVGKLTVESYTPLAAATTITLVASGTKFIIAKNGVVLDPGVDYTITGTTQINLVLAANGTDVFVVNIFS